MVPVFLFFCIAAVLGSIIFTRHRERMTMIEKGLDPEQVKSLYTRGTWKFDPLSSLKWGMVLVGIGLAILLGSWLHANHMVEEGVYPGLIGLFGGIGLVLFYLLARKKSE
jgi:hypothetical protein